MRLRADAEMRAALAAADGGASALAACVEEAVAAIRFVCGDAALDPRERVLLIDEALLLLAAMKDAVKTADASALGPIMEILRRSGGLLRRYAAFARGSPPGPL